MLVAASACDVGAPTRLHVALYMAPREDAADGLSPPIVPSRVTLGVRLRDATLTLPAAALSAPAPAESPFFVLNASNASNATLALPPPASPPPPSPPPLVPYNARPTGVRPHSDGGRGYVCCGATRHFRVGGLLEANALRVRLNVTSGRLQALFLKWGSCPQESHIDRVRGICTGFCTMASMTTRGQYSGSLYSRQRVVLTVPHGHAEQPDKRRRGNWYVSVQALPGEAAMFDLDATVTTPVYIPPSARCSKTTFACANDSARGTWNQGGHPAPPPSQLELAWIAAQEADSRLVSSGRISAVIAQGYTSRLVPMGVALITGLLCWWFYRSYRFRRKHLYRMPHDAPF